MSKYFVLTAALIVLMVSCGKGFEPQAQEPTSKYAWNHIDHLGTITRYENKEVICYSGVSKMSCKFK